MARRTKTKFRNNFGQFATRTTVVLSKTLKQTAKKCDVDLKKSVAEYMVKVYKQQVIASYEPRSESGKKVKQYNEEAKRKEVEMKKTGKYQSTRVKRMKLTYRHTSTIANHIKSRIDGNRIYVYVDRDAKYPRYKYKGMRPNADGKSEIQYEEKKISARKILGYLNTGAEGNDKKYLYKGSDNKMHFGTNYDTPRHDIDLHTQNIMNGYIQGLKQSSDMKKYIRDKMNEGKKTRNRR